MSKVQYPKVLSVAAMLSFSLAAQSSQDAQSATLDQKTQQPTTEPATTIVHDFDTAVPANQLLLRSDDYNSVGQATYTQSTVSLSGHGWQLDLYNQSTRTIWLTFSKPAPGSPPAPVSDGYYYDYVEAYSRCWDLNNNEIPLVSIPAGTSNNRCTLASDFGVGRTKYKFVMGQPSITGTSTGWASVSCNAANGSTCTSWTIIPYMGSPNATVSNLYQYGTHGLQYIGSYSNTYRIDVTAP
jgi:hypothetical protein